MKQENYDMSEKKWNDKDGIVAELMKPGRVDWEKLHSLIRSACGHCGEYNLACSNCGLKDMSLCGDGGSGDYSILYFMTSYFDRTPHNKRKALRIAKRVYRAILKDDPRNPTNAPT